MIDIPALNWVILGVEIAIATLWASIFCVELFSFLEGQRIKLKINDSTFTIRKSFWGLIRQIRRLIFNLALLAIMVFITYYFKEEQSTFTIMSATIIGLAVLVIPRGFYFILRLSPYWVRQIKYITLFTLFFYPLFIIDGTIIPADGIAYEIWNYGGGFVRFLFPTELLRMNGHQYTLSDKYNLFLLVFVGIPLLIALLNYILPRIFFSVARFNLYQWNGDEWVLPVSNEDEELTMGVLLVHGMGSNYKTWSSYTKETNSTRIVDFLEDKIDKKYLNTKIYSLQFSDKLKNHLDVKYSFTNSDNPLYCKAKLNNYVWELLSAIFVIKELGAISKLHIVSHSTGGIVVRKMFEELYENDHIQQIYEAIGFNNETNNWDFIDQVSWMAVPHFGARGGSAVVMNVQDKKFYRYGVRVLFWIPVFERLFDTLGRALTILGLDAQGANDLDPESNFLRKLNGSPPRVALYGRQIWKNAIADLDQVVGKGALIEERYYHYSSFLSLRFYEKTFQADHGNAPWEQLKQLPKNKIHEYPPIHHSIPAIFWVFELEEDEK